MSSTHAGTTLFGNIPMRSRRLTAVPLAANAVDPVLLKGLTTNLVLAVVFQKVAFHLGEAQFAMVVGTNAGVMAWLFYQHRLRVSTARLFLFVLAFGGALLTQLFVVKSNPGSYILTCVVAAPFLAVADTNRETYLAFLKRFQVLGVVVVCLVLFDHVCQVFGPGMPDIERFMPVSMVYTNYVYIQPVVWQSAFSKPNAIIFLEASFTSQFIAIALIFEIALFQRIRHILFYALGLLAVFAGTGIVLVLAVSPFLVTRFLSTKIIMAGLVALPILAGAAIATGWVDMATSRMDEFGEHGQSGNARFVAPFVAVADMIIHPVTDTILFGNGAGQLEKSTDLMLIPMTKISLEYGLIVLGLYFAYSLFWLTSSGVPIFIMWLIFVHFHLMNGGASQPITAVYGWLLAGGYNIIRPVPERRKTPAAMLAPRASYDLTDALAAGK